MAWNTEGVKTDPAADALLADTGALGVGTKPLTIIVWNNTGDAQIVVAVRNATNTGDVTTQRFRVAGTTQVYQVPVTLALNQRVVVRMVDGITGDIQASILD